MSHSKMVKYNDIGEFDVLNESMAELASGGAFFHFGSSRKEVNNGCIEDKNNTSCYSVNNLCAADTVCGEIM